MSGHDALAIFTLRRGRTKNDIALGIACIAKGVVIAYYKAFIHLHSHRI